jgi:hypothetical protein
MSFTNNGSGIPTSLGKTPIQPGYIYEPYNNYTILGDPDVKVINASNPDPRIYVDPASPQYSQWTADANLLTEWNNMPFKYYILLGTVFSGTATDGLRFPVYIPSTTTYDVQILIYGAGGNTDSCFIAMDGEAAIQFGTPSLVWRTGLAAKNLAAGNHTLELYMREQMGIGGIRIVPTSGTAPTLNAFRQNFTGSPLFSQLSQAATSSAVGAFSLRAVNGTSAMAVNVRNGTTSATQDFYADRLGNLLTAPVTGQTLASWLGGATGYVTTWYDQSGLGNHATQATAANQPIIQRATKGPGYACLFNGANSQVLRCAAGTYSLLNGTKYAACVTERRNNAGTAGTQGGYFGIGDASGTKKGLIAGYWNLETNMEYSHRGDNLDNTVAAYAGASEPIRCTVFDYSASTTKRVYINGSILPVTNTSTDLVATAGAMTIGKSFATGNSGYYYGEMYEILVFTRSLYDLDGTTTITQIYQNQLGIYGT